MSSEELLSLRQMIQTEYFMRELGFEDDEIRELTIKTVNTLVDGYDDEKPTGHTTTPTTSQHV
jgi:hypothetical protein